MKIYLADLIHDYLPGNYVTPLNVGLLKSYLLSKFSKDLEIKLFKSPEKLLKNIKNDIKDGNAPDIVGFSNYSWNQELNRNIIHRIIEINPDTVICEGGPHIRVDPEGIADYLKINDEVDYYCMFEGEIPLGNLIEYFLKNKVVKKELCDEPIPGVAYITKDKRLSYPVITATDKTITHIPSPYLSGVLDEFLEEPQWVPLLETNRGCPFACTFCVWGISALDKVRVFPLERAKEEIEYVAKKSPSPRWIFADANFGMLKRDLELAEKIRDVSDKYGLLEHPQVWWAKNSSKNTLEISKTFGRLVDPLAAVQTMDVDVLKKIKRGNIKYSTMTDLLDQWSKDNLTVGTDVLVGLPGESLESHHETLRKVFDLNFSRVEVGNIRLLPGSEMETDQCRDEYKLKTKFRLISGGYGKYDGMPIFEYEESVRSSKDITEEEMLSLRKVHFFIYAFWNLGIAKPILRYLHTKMNQNPLDLILKLIHSTKNEKISKFLADFEKEAREEWFDSADELREYYSENFEKLMKNGFLKMNFKYLARILLDKEFARTLIEGLIDETDDKAAKKLSSFCLERIYFPGSNELVKTILYDEDMVNILKILYPRLTFDSKKCKFEQKEKLVHAINYELQKFNFENEPLRALALTLETYRSNFLYDFQFGKIGKESENDYTSSFDYHAQLGNIESASYKKYV